MGDADKKGTALRKVPRGRVVVHVEHNRYSKSMVFDLFVEENTAKQN